MMQLVRHFGLTQAEYNKLTIEQHYNYLEEFSRMVEESKK